MIVFDASTLILIAKAELLDLFLAASKLEAVIPPEVAAECIGGKKTFDALVIEKALDEARIRVVPVRNRRLVEKLRADFSLGKGEAEAVALALLEGAALLGIDDKQGINACKLVGVPFTTAISILVRTWEKGLLERSDALAKLAALAKYGRYRTSIIEDARRTLEERA